MQKHVKVKLIWNGSDFGFPGSDDLIIDLLSNAQRYIRAITTFVDVRKIPTPEELNLLFADVVKQFIEYMHWVNGEVVLPEQVSDIKIKLDSARGLPKFSLKYQKNESVTVVYVFRISNKYGGPIAKLRKKLSKPLREYKEDYPQQAPKPKHGTATETPAVDECKPGIVIRGKIDDAVSDLLSKSFERISK